MEFFFFLLFGLSLLGMYISIRQQLIAPGLTAGAGVVASILFMSLFLLVRGAGTIQGIIMGILIGALFAGAALAIAWYFQSNDMRRQYIAQTFENAETPDTHIPGEQEPDQEYYEDSR